MGTTGTVTQFATKEELEWLEMGPFDGGIPGLVRRIRRILDVSQRGLAARIDVSQSVVARWETGRTSPRASVLQALLRLAGLVPRVHSAETGEEVGPMRDDGARQHGGNRFPAHTDLRVTGWWVPSGVPSTSSGYYDWIDRSRAAKDPMIRFRTCAHDRRLERMVRGTPVDHPSLRQLAAEAEHLDEHLDEQRETRRVVWGRRVPAA
ncbi:helix-turn-helix transcriptional regulator [Nocardioides sp. S5]|uniref:helix-turn-helix domain-containing protein n=1 Tax=Nocardioides sp. S5 TaxID=2017486 RepID=UPI001A8DA517|nr:helix-turn-helix transcriptional regulator [Nocardioides sp. S5]